MLSTATMAEYFDLNTLTLLVARALQVDVGAVRLIAIPIGKHNRSYYIESPAGAHVLRIAPPDDAGFLFYEVHMMRQEPALHTLIRKHLPIPVADVVHYDFTRTHFERDYLIMTALPGIPLSAATNLTPARLNRALRQTGECLRQLHSLTAEKCLGQGFYGYVGAHKPMTPQPTWWDAFRLMWHKLIDDVVTCQAYSPEEGQAMRDLLDYYRRYFDRPVVSRLLHMDVWSQNILVDDAGNVTGLVDFDRALWGDPEIEFAVLDYCGISEPAFWEGYGTMRDTSAAAAVRRQFYLLYEVQKYMPIEIWRRNNPASAQRYKQQCLALAAELLPSRSRSIN
ncbi:MAG: aminoglycoside phosphotransferase family protein [Anaerolineae bacterium]|nr:aminoglycoside phosphotransferase family protein [Thermoflexales bacterium]MDW8407183.1 aminoglycoside phosphotransferase family protein [Anaerolineae bacterium]